MGKRQRRKQRATETPSSLDPTKPDFALKLDWADHHIDTLNQALERWFDRGAYTLVDKRDPETGYNILCAKVEEPPEPEWPLLLGDAVHNLRAALDHVAYALMEAHQSKTNPNSPIPAQMLRDSEFPIIGHLNERSGVSGDGEHRFDSAAGSKLKGVDRDARAAIKALQPYHRGAEFCRDPLWLIHDLDRVDKHRRLSVVATAVNVTEVSLGGTGFFPHLWLGGGPVEDGTKVAEWADPTGPAPDMKIDFRREVTLRESIPSSVPEPPVVQFLASLLAYMRERVLPKVEPFL